MDDMILYNIGTLILHIVSDICGTNYGNKLNKENIYATTVRICRYLCSKKMQQTRMIQNIHIRIY